jgi:hypothetical protein
MSANALGAGGISFGGFIRIAATLGGVSFIKGVAQSNQESPTVTPRA